MGSSPDSIPPGWEEAITSSPETLPPGFENSSSLSTPTSPPRAPTSPPRERTSSSLTSPDLPLPLENQVNITHFPPSPSPTTPQESHSHQNTPLKLPQENRGPLSQPLWPLRQETPISLPPFSSLQQEKLDAIPRSPLQPQDAQGPLSSSQLSQGNLAISNPPPPQSLPATEMGQMVCGSCNELLSYPRGSKYVQCAGCQTTNFVLEAHQVGIVKCGKCSVLLMYPYTSKSLRCSSCHYVTEIGPHNICPPVSVLQGFPSPP